MIIELIVIILFAWIGLTLLKMEHHTKTIKIIAIILIGLVIYFSIVGVFNSDKVDITSPKGIVNAVYFYIGWIGQAAVDVWDIGVDGVKTVGNAIKLNKTDEQPRR